MLRKYILFSISLFLLCNVVFAQEWVNKLQDPSANFFSVQKSFNTYWKKKERVEKLKRVFSFGQHIEEEQENYILYKRWENFVYPRVYPTGDRSLIHEGDKTIGQLISNHAYKSVMQTAGNWQPLGAFVVPNGDGGAGRLNCVRFHPNNQNIIYVGAPSGGLWKSSNAGSTWTTATDALPTLGINDIAIDATNPSVMYVATGDRDASDTYGVGVLKSSNGGISWNITGLNATTNQSKIVNRILINPNNHAMLFAATSNGVYKSTDGGLAWVKVLAVNNIKDMELKPGDPSTIYAASASTFYVSTNTGTSFSAVTNGLPLSSAIGRIAIAVTPANPQLVYLLFSESSANGFLGLYRSSNSGVSFNEQSSSPNLLGYNTDGQDSGGNGWYTLSIAVSPVSENEVVVGGVNIWQSFDGGLNWNLNAYWTGNGGVPYVHADIHDLVYSADGGICYAACDGGIFSTPDAGSNWFDNSGGGMQIAQMYRLGCAATNANLVLQGWQDNGTNLYSAGAWSNVIGGDGMECFIDWSNSNYMYGEYQNGALNRSSNGGVSFTGIGNTITESGAWVTPWLQDPVDPQTIYAGYQNVWKSTDRGNTWSTISTFNTSGLTCLVVAISNPQYIYASDGNTLYKTNNGGSTWSTVTNPFGSGYITHITLSESDENKLWLTYSGYTTGKKVFKSIDGGVTWSNISFNLPNIPANCGINQLGTTDGIYVGTDVGVYYIDNNLTSWIPYSNGLPNVIVDELEIHYASNKLRAATYGRGLWETGIYNPNSNLPFANFSADSVSGCPGMVVHFADSTLNAPTTWNWSFPGGTPSTSTLQNPVVTYNTPGIYNDVTLVVGNINGSDSITKLSYIAVSPQIEPFITINGNDSICQGHSTQFIASAGNTYKWHPTNQLSQNINVNTAGTYSVTVTDAFGCASTSQPLSIQVFPIPSIPTVSIIGDTLISSIASGYQWYLNGTAISAATNQRYLMNGVVGLYKVVITDSIGLCTSTSAVLSVGIEEYTNGVSFVAFPNPSNGIVTVALKATILDKMNVVLLDAVGKEIYKKTVDDFVGSIEMPIDLGVLPKGVYFLTISNSKGIASKKIMKY